MFWRLCLRVGKGEGWGFGGMYVFELMNFLQLKFEVCTWIVHQCSRFHFGPEYT